MHDACMHATPLLLEWQTMANYGKLWQELSGHCLGHLEQVVQTVHCITVLHARVITIAQHIEHAQKVALTAAEREVFAQLLVLRAAARGIVYWPVNTVTVLVCLGHDTQQKISILCVQLQKGHYIV